MGVCLLAAAATAISMTGGAMVAMMTTNEVDGWTMSSTKKNYNKKLIIPCIVCQPKPVLPL